LSKQVDEISYFKKDNGKFVVGVSKGNVDISEDVNLPSEMTINEVESYLGKSVAEKIEKGEGKKIENNFQGKVVKLKKLEGDNLKVGGSGMIGFYGSPSQGKEGIVGGVAKALVKELTGKSVQIGVTEIEISDSKVDLDTPPSISKKSDGKIGVQSPFEGEGKVFDADEKQEALAYLKEQKIKYDAEIAKRKQSTQHSIEITPELKAAVEKGMPLFQKNEGKVIGAYTTNIDGTQSIHLFDGATVETLFHEKGHGLKTIMEDIADNATTESKKQAIADEKIIQNWVGAKGRDWTRAQHEKLANGFVNYLRTNEAPTKALKEIFGRLKAWLTDVFNAAKSTSTDIDLPQNVIDVFDRLLGNKDTTSDTKRKRLISDEAYEKAQKEIKDSMGNLGSGTGFKGAGALATIAAKHIEDGAISLAQVTKLILAEFGDKIKPYIKAAYDAATKGRSKVQELASLANTIDGLKAKITDNAEALKIVSTEVKKLIKDSKLSSFSKKAVSKILTKIKNTKASNFNKIIDSINEIIDRDIERATRKEAMSNRKAAYKNIGKLGMLKELKGPLMKMLKIDPTLLSGDIIAEYNAVVKELAKKGTKYADKSTRTELMDKINEINDSFSSDFTKANELYTRIVSEIDEDISLKENLDDLVKRKKIDKADRELLERFSGLFELNTKEVQDDNARESIEEDFDAVLEEEQSDFVSTTKDEQSAVDYAGKITKEDLDGLSDAKARALVRGLEIMKMGFVGHQLLSGVSSVKANRTYKVISKNTVAEIKGIDTVISKVMAFISNIYNWQKSSNVTSIEKRLRSMPIINIEQTLKTTEKFKLTKIYSLIFRPSAVSIDKSIMDMDKATKLLEKAESLLDKRQNKRFIQKARIMVHQIQREFESNEGNKEVNAAYDWIKATLDDKNSVYDAAEKVQIQKILDDFVKNDGIELTLKEETALKLIDRTYEFLEPMAEFDASQQGLAFNLRKNRVHLPKASKKKKSESSDLNDLLSIFTNATVKNDALTQRTGKVHSISLDPIQNAYDSARKTIPSYHMYSVIKEAKSVLGKLTDNAKTKGEQEIYDSISAIYDGIIVNKYKSVKQNKLGLDQVLTKLQRGGYLAQLGGPIKGVVELVLNMYSAVNNYPKALAIGFKHLASLSAEEKAKIVKILPTSQGSRVSREGDLDSKDVDSGLMNSIVKFRRAEMTSEAMSNAKVITKFIGFVFNKGMKVNEFIVTKPDQYVSSPLLFGKTDVEFKKITGESIDYKALANDPKYAVKHKDALALATEKADVAIVDVAASNNSFEGIPNNIKDKEASAAKQIFQFVDSYMTNFRKFEYGSALKGIRNLMGRGEITKLEGAMLLVSTVVRMALFRMFIDMVFGWIFKAMGIPLDEDEDDPYIKRGVLSSVITLALGRNLGNVSQLGLNHLIEIANEEYGEGITYEGEYDSFNDRVAFDKLREQRNKNVAVEAAVNSMGSLTPMAKTTVRAFDVKRQLDVAKTQKTKDKKIFELTYRVPFEIAGNTGYIPGYKTWRKIGIEWLFQDEGKSKGSSKGGRR